ncbi:MAG: SDR family NAD(P)-dependent oxidoreductase, partial [Spirochaetota bacterium]
MEQSRSYALVTGASGGIGKEFALLLAAGGKPLVLVGRNGRRLEAVKAELASLQAAGTMVIPCDLAEPGAAARLHAACAEKGLVVDMLINNAGSGLFGQAIDLELKGVEAMVTLNISSLTNLCSLFGRDMRKRGHGDILNVGSFAGLNATPFFASYAATKSYVLNYSLALRAELASAGINVCCLMPGYVRTDFDANAGIESDKYKNFSHANSMGAAEVAKLGLSALARRRPAVIAGTRNRFAAFLFGLLPRSLPPRI